MDLHLQLEPKNNDNIKPQLKSKIINICFIREIIILFKRVAESST